MRAKQGAATVEGKGNEWIQKYSEEKVEIICFEWMGRGMVKARQVQNDSLVYSLYKQMNGGVIY